MIFINSVILSLWFVSVQSNEINYLNSSALKINPTLYSDMTQLFKLCDFGASNPVAITENLMDTMSDGLINTVKSPILVINEDFLPTNSQIYYPTHPLYILSADTTGQLENLLMLLKSSPFWNMKSTFFIIGKANKFCRDSAEILKEMWKFELLSSFVVCFKTNNQTMLYTYNPYTNRAPDSWIAVRNKEKSEQRWTLYKKALKNDPRICKSFKFDKTQFMDRYPVKIVTGTVDGVDLVDRLVFSSLNMQREVHVLDEYYSDDYPVMLEKYDITTGYSDLDSTDLHINIIPVVIEYHYSIVTLKRSFTYSFREVIMTLDYQTLFAAISIILFIFIVIVVNNRYHVRLAFLDVLKMLLSMDMNSLFGRPSMKFLFFTASFFMFSFEPAIESQLFALLTRPQSFTIESLEDLHDHQYHVYFPNSVGNRFMNEQLWTTVDDMRYLHPVATFNPDDCLELVSNNNTVACVFQSDKILEKAEKKNLHVANKFPFVRNGVGGSRKDWALNDRLYQRMLNVVESGFVNLVDINLKFNILQTIRAKEKINQLHQYDEITEANLHYAYVTFMVCQIIGICIFIVERLITRLTR